jgi:hypothetical protein
MPLGEVDELVSLRRSPPSSSNQNNVGLTSRVGHNTRGISIDDGEVGIGGPMTSPTLRQTHITEFARADSGGHDSDDGNEKTREKKEKKRTAASASSNSSQHPYESHQQQDAKCCESMKNDIGELVHRMPGSARILRHINRLPRSVRIGFLILWLIWKVFMTIVFIRVALHTVRLSHETISAGLASSSGNSGVAPTSQLSPIGAITNVFDSANNPNRNFRILHIVTALAEYNNGMRGTSRGEDRLSNMLIPLLAESVTSMKNHKPHWTVDVYLVLGWELAPERRALIEQALPKGVNLEIWDDAVPLGYDKQKNNKISAITRTLARQHRLVIYDKLDDYDFFNVWEDDMRITAQHVQYFMDMSQEFEHLRLEALEKEEGGNRDDSSSKRGDLFYGNLSSAQIKSMVPGFFRVEVMPSIEDANKNTQQTVDPVPTDSIFEDIVSQTSGKAFFRQSKEEKHLHINPRPCCHVLASSHEADNSIKQEKADQATILQKLPTTPAAEQLMTWETNIMGFSLREFPSSSTLDWVAFQLGPKGLPDEQYTHSFWSGEPGYFGPETERAIGGNPQLFGQQGGYMLHRAHILRLEQDLCPGRYLPPFDEPYFKQDGLWMNNVEFYSGGYQIFSDNRMKAGCNLQRVVDLNPANFSKHLLYHTSNNKQRTITINRRVKVDNLFGQLNTVRKAAMAKKVELVKQGQHPLEQ